MRIPLTRIEYEYVLETFFETLPPLFMQIGRRIYRFNPHYYRLQKSRIYFSLSVKSIPEHVCTYFYHRGRSICFMSAVYAGNHGYFILIPDILYKYDIPKKSKCQSIYADIYGQDQKILRAYEHPHFPLDTVMPNTVDGMTVVPYSTDTDTCKSFCLQVPLCWYRIRDFEQKAAQEGRMYGTLPTLLFADSRYILCSCTNAAAASIMQHTAFRFIIRFPHRTIMVDEGKRYLLRKTKLVGIKIAGFILNRAFEEDRRFLYEKAYHEKYNPAYIIQDILGKRKR